MRRRRLPKCSYSSRRSSTGSRGSDWASSGEVLDRLALVLVHARLGDAEHLGQRDELLDQLDDVARGERAGVERLVDVQARVELVAPHAREVVALGVEEQLVEQVLRGVDRRRLARALLLEQLDQRALLGLGDLGVGLQREPHVERVVEEVQDLLVGAGPAGGHVAALAQHLAHGAQQHRDRQLALAVDADEDLALLVDLQLEPGAARRHQVGDEDLLLAVLGLHHVGARRAHELRDDHALGAVDDERAPVGHPREVAHEDGLLADLTGLAVLERDLDGQRARVGEVLLAALGDRGDRVVEVDVLEDDGEVAGVVLDRRDIVDRLPEATLLGVHQPLERAPLNIDQVGNFEAVLQAGETAARSRDISTCQDGDSLRS